MTQTTVDETTTAAEQQARAALAGYIRRHQLPEPSPNNGASWMPHMRVLYISVTPGEMFQWAAATRKHPVVKAQSDIYGQGPKGDYGHGPGHFAHIDLTIGGCPMSILTSWRTA